MTDQQTPPVNPHAPIPWAESTFAQKLGEPTTADLEHTFSVGELVAVDDMDGTWKIKRVEGIWIGLELVTDTGETDVVIARRASRLEYIAGV